MIPPLPHNKMTIHENTTPYDTGDIPRMIDIAALQQNTEIREREGGWFIDLTNHFPTDNPYKINIVGIGAKPANQFQAHPDNWRGHPEEQRETMKEILGVFGIVAGVIENKSTGHLIDGHERIYEAMEKGEETIVPYLLVDVPEEKEGDLLLVFDKVGEMVYAKPDQITLLLSNSIIDEIESPNIANLLKKIIPKHNEPIIEFENFDEENVKTDHQCPQCGFQFS